ncbi:hypothetical protein P4O66_019590 [Electrophorus voltai]|uniref:Uncharacterized protein n=1 Tax=Electrophorus voltai TaxID=2609070 RepID=A0AAD8ZTS0_9TELE|nr:hypothetical protein P4O66_019590 [Electrophorus voltai]
MDDLRQYKFKASVYLFDSRGSSQVGRLVLGVRHAALYWLGHLVCYRQGKLHGENLVIHPCSLYRHVRSLAFYKVVQAMTQHCKAVPECIVHYSRCGLCKARQHSDCTAVGTNLRYPIQTFSINLQPVHLRVLAIGNRAALMSLSSAASSSSAYEITRFTRALAQVMRQTAPAEALQREESLVVPGQPYDTVPTRTAANSLQSTQMTSVGPSATLMQAMTQYPALGQVSHAYEQPQLGKESNKYASLKAVAEKANENFYTNRRHVVDLAAKGTLPLQPVHLEPEPANPYSPERPKMNGHRAKSTKVPCSLTLPYGSSTIASPGMLKAWDATETLARRHTYGPKRHNALLEQVNELASVRSQPYLPPQPYFITNSKTEVTV